LHATSIPGLWLEELFTKLKLPYWLGVVIMAFPVFAALELIDSYLIGSDPLQTVVSNLDLPILFVYVQFAALYAGRQTERILNYAESAGAGDTARIRRRLYSKKWTLLVIVMVYIVTLPLSVSQGLGVFRSALISATYAGILGATLLWVFAYSMKSLYGLGRTPLTLKPFAEDRTLGLKPFGTAALKLTAIYEVFAIGIGIPIFITRNLPLIGIVTGGSFALLGFVFFFLPLLSFRTKLMLAKKRELDWIGPRYAQVVNALKASKSLQVDERIVGELSALDKIQRDVQQIHTWPFDVGIVSRLISITVLPITITVVAREVILLTLHV
jgi:hypothetical protein